ncbi:hypothetical protein [Spiroplasma endosymbiont of Phyllotreta cruciferae]|uniref:hypothetical protein n=1 Tax=Spiroplasma endosymbiont of Phyllotreta cruciferae TaxID=2886375 RepID=UPI00209E2E10|nr:hypothetical protein [Spiroplasma endosymbiont of Phyllotreta cruciferae]
MSVPPGQASAMYKKPKAIPFKIAEINPNKKIHKSWIVGSVILFKSCKNENH